MEFSVTAWNAVSHCCNSKKTWQQYFQNENQNDSSSVPDSVDLSFLPAIKRRRLSNMARLMFAAAWPLLDENEVCPVVFVSFDGEVNRSLQLWNELLAEECLSPTSFALSVHNAVIGQWSLFRQDTSESTALSAKHSALEVGVVEACGLLIDGAHRVIVVIAEDPIADDDLKNVEKAPFPYALVMLIEKGDQVSLTFDSTLTSSGTPSYYQSSFAWIQNQISGQQQWSCAATSGTWHWRVKS